MREEGVVLEDGVDRPAIGRDAFDRLAEDLDMARGRLLEAGDQPQAGRLAGAGRPEHGEEFARRDVEVDAVDGPDRAEMPVDAAKKDRGRRRWESKWTT